MNNSVISKKLITSTIANIKIVPGRRYHADVLLKAPMKKYLDYSFLESIATYVFPFGILIQSFPEKSEVRSFVLTEVRRNDQYISG